MKSSNDRPVLAKKRGGRIKIKSTPGHPDECLPMTKEQNPFPSFLFEKLRKQLAEVNGSEVNPATLNFSFEQPPLRENWYEISQ